MSLYTPQILALAADLAHYPLLPGLPLRAEARSRTCGSVITIGLEYDDRQIRQIGMQVSACAIGQASAAIMASNITGAGYGDIVRVHDDLARWLAHEGDLPDWPGLELIAPALPHKGRHGALLLPWKAARDALSSASGKS
ncbi:MAG: iron-sulfur cluster assembly scaffold protein [Erythrobacter sp.]